jgi:glycerol-3-phosphate cytidylyltransferase
MELRKLTEEQERLFTGDRKMPLHVYTGGTFDLFHAGHVNLLKKLSTMGLVTVGLNTDEFIIEYKGKPPVCSYEERKIVLENNKFVYDVIANIGGADSKPAIEKAHPDILAIGSDWARKDYYKQMGFTQDWLDEKGIILMYVPYTHGISTTDIKQRI